MFSMKWSVYLRLVGVCFLFLPLINCMNPFQRNPIRQDCFKKTDKYCSVKTSPLWNTSSNGVKPETYIYLFTPDNPKDPEYLHECAFELSETSNFNASNPTEILIHGWIQGMCTSSLFRDIKDQLLIKGPYNVILVDWTWKSQDLYEEAVPNLKIVALHVATVIKNIMRQRGVSRSSFHIVGHSLGAQTAGLVGNHIKVGRITGLDPAGPCFEKDRPLHKKLDASDADFVDIIHTNMGTKLPFLGNYHAHGHAIFFVNGGKNQISCYLTMLTFLMKSEFNDASFMLMPTSCSHMQSLEFYKTSINPDNCQFVGIECNNHKDFQRGLCNSCKDSLCAVMGMDLPKYINQGLIDAFPAKFYVDTDIKCPYCNNDRLDLNGFFNKSSG